MTYYYSMTLSQPPSAADCRISASRDPRVDGVRRYKVLTEYASGQRLAIM